MVNILPPPLTHRKIAYISDQHLPVRKANAEQIVNTVAALADAGLDIKLVIPGKWRRLGRSKQDRIREIVNFYSTSSEFKLTEIPHLPLSPFKLDKLTHGLLAPLYSVMARSDMIYTRNAQSAFVALGLGKNVLFEVYRIYEKGKSLSVNQLARFTRRSNALRIITHSLFSKNSLLETGADDRKVRVIHNGFNPASMTPALSRSDARGKLGWSEHDNVACYAGRIDIDKGVAVILEMAKKTPEIRYVLIGCSEKDSEDWIKRAADEKGLKNIHKLPWVTAAELPVYLFASDALIIPPSADPMMVHGTTGLPLKTFLYLASGRPILAPDLPDMRTVLNEKNAVLVEADNLGGAVTAVRKIFTDRGWANALSGRAREDAGHYTWAGRAKKIIEFMDDRD